MPNAAGLVIFGAPPVTSAAQFPEAFLPNPAMSCTGRVKLSESEAQVFACAFLAPASTLPTSEFVSAAAPEQLGRHWPGAQFRR